MFQSGLNQTASFPGRQTSVEPTQTSHSWRWRQWNTLTTNQNSMSTSKKYSWTTAARWSGLISSWKREAPKTFFFSPKQRFSECSGFLHNISNTHLPDLTCGYAPVRAITMAFRNTSKEISLSKSYRKETVTKTLQHISSKLHVED